MSEFSKILQKIMEKNEMRKKIRHQVCGFQKLMLKLELLKIYN